MGRSRASIVRWTGDKRPANQPPIASSGGSSSIPIGALDSAAWLSDRGVTPPAWQRWHVEIVLDVTDARPPTDYDETTATRFHLDIYKEEWGIYFCHAGYSSWIRVTDIAFVHGRDDYRLLSSMPSLKDAGSLLRRIEQQHQIAFKRHHARIRTNLSNAEGAFRRWIASH
jgi:hypothetical protein